MPLAIGACGIDMDGNQDYILRTQPITPAVRPLDTLFQRDVFELRNQELGDVVAVLEMRHDGSGNLTRVLIFFEMAIRRAFARGFPAVAIVH